ncbi:MAG: isoamylase early set domain-containing protein [Nitrospiria bacterium]
MSLSKKYLKSKPVCKVKFELPKEATENASRVLLLGDFNNWDANTIPMKRLKKGGFTSTVNLPSGKEYQFKYLIDEGTWENDWKADKYVPNSYGDSDNSVVVV